MAQNPLRNISLKHFRDFLKWKGLKYINTNGGHEKWTRLDLGRPVIFQTHISPIPLFIVQNIFRTIGATAQDYIDFLKES